MGLLIVNGIDEYPCSASDVGKVIDRVHIAYHAKGEEVFEMYYTDVKAKRIDRRKKRAQSRKQNHHRQNNHNTNQGCKISKGGNLRDLIIAYAKQSNGQE